MKDSKSEPIPKVYGGVSISVRVEPPPAVLLTIHLPKTCMSRCPAAWTTRRLWAQMIEGSAVGVRDAQAALKKLDEDQEP